MPVSTPEDGTPLKPGHVYMAAPDHHLVVAEDVVRVVRGPKENGFRPAVDVLFQSAASTPRQKLIGVILSGSLADGVRGARAIKAAGGRVIVQDPAEAQFPEMPRRAEMHADFVEGAATIPELLVRLMEEPVSERESTYTPNRGQLTEFTCPECGGVLREMSDRVTYGCHVGHAFSQESLLAHAHQTVEGALWRAIRVLNEHSKLLRTLAGRMREVQSAYSADRFESRAAEVEESLAVLRNLLLSSGLLDIAEDDLVSGVGRTSAGPE
jgi:two-component system chemotaxis response regulator CheB